MKELSKAIQPMLLKMTNQLADRVYETLNYFLQDCYSGYDPLFYQRTKDFLYSAVKVEAKPYKGGVKASVYIDYDSLDSYKGVTGYQVVKWADDGLHGGMEVDHGKTVSLLNRSYGFNLSEYFRKICEEKEKECISNNYGRGRANWG